jgi:hypothetical protein
MHGSNRVRRKASHSRRLPSLCLLQLLRTQQERYSTGIVLRVLQSNLEPTICASLFQTTSMLNHLTCHSTNYGQYRGSDRYTVSESYSYSLQQDNPQFNLIASNSGTIVDGLSFQANALSGYWCGFNVNLLGEADLPAVCSLDANGILSCSGHQLVTNPQSSYTGVPSLWPFYTAYEDQLELESTVACEIDGGILQCTTSWGANVLQLISWDFFGYPDTYMLGISTQLEENNYPVTLEVQPI